MGKICWDDKIINHLIDRVQEATFIWDYTNIAYKNKLKKQEFWLQVVENLNKEFCPSVEFTYAEVVKKWNNLKSYYTAESQKLLRAEKSGASSEALEELQYNWKYKSRLDFLTSTTVTTPSVNNFNKRSLQNLRNDLLDEDSAKRSGARSFQFSCNEMGTEKSPICSTPICLVDNNTSSFDDLFEVCYDDFDNTFGLSDRKTEATQTQLSSQPSSSALLHPRKRAKSAKPVSNTLVASTLMEASKELTKAVTGNIGQEKVTEDSAFGTCISAEISKLDADLKINAKKQIFNVIMDLQSEQLKRNNK